MSFLYAAFGPTLPNPYTMNSTKGLTAAERKEYAELRLIPSYEARKRLSELQGKIVAASQQKAKAGLQKPRKAIRKVSPKQAKVNAEYTKLRKIYLTENPKCQWPGCYAEATDIHHSELRGGKTTLKVESWRGLCRMHHTCTHENPKEARELGMLK